MAFRGLRGMTTSARLILGVHIGVAVQTNEHFEES
jgi:hypothetical protein